jgi:hypothetical protein
MACIGVGPFSPKLLASQTEKALSFVPEAIQEFSVIKIGCVLSKIFVKAKANKTNRAIFYDMTSIVPRPN